VTDGRRGRHKRRSRVVRRRRILVFAGVAALAVIGGFVAYTALTGPLIVIPDDSCTQRPPLRTVDGVRLQPVAMEAFLQAQTDAGEPIPVVESYRSCGQQRMACKNICGDPLGCPGLCAPPGKSWHQLGAAVDITQEGLDTPAVVTALEDNGWCQSVPDSDPGHFSFDGCH